MKEKGREEKKEKKEKKKKRRRGLQERAKVWNCIELVWFWVWNTINFCMESLVQT